MGAYGNGPENYPTPRELESKAICQHIAYVYRRTGKHVPDWIADGARKYYGCVNRLEDLRSLLIDALHGMSDDERESIVYDAKSREARALADWSEYHSERIADDVRAKKEKADQAKTIESALAKLTPDERQALGFK